MHCLTSLPRHILHINPCFFPVCLNSNSHSLPCSFFFFIVARHWNFNPAVCGQAVLLLVSLVIVPMTSSVAALLTFIRLLSSVPKHVPLQVHALVATVAAHSTLERFGTWVHPLVALQIGQVPASVVAQMALVRFLACVHSVVALEVVKMCWGIVALWALVRFFAAVSLHVACQVVWVVCEEGAGGTCVHLVTAFAWAVGRRWGVFC